MANWGAKPQDREALLEYLVANFGDDKPAANQFSRATEQRRRRSKKSTS